MPEGETNISRQQVGPKEYILSTSALFVIVLVVGVLVVLLGLVAYGNSNDRQGSSDFLSSMTGN